MGRIILVAAILFLIDVPTRGQAPSEQQVTAPTRTINLTLEQRHIIREFVLKDPNVKDVTLAVQLDIGGGVPPSVALQPFPPEVSAKVPQVKSHSFFVTAGRVVVVDPKDNRIADVIEPN
jgi:uncharacterized protein DUF1236